MKFTNYNKASKTAFIILSFLLITAIRAGANEILDYAPFFKGSSWTYETQDSAMELFEVTGYRDLDDIRAVECQSSLTGPVYFVMTTDALFRFRDIRSKGKDIFFSNGIVLLKSPLETGRVWESDMGGSIHRLQFLSKETIDTKAGSFRDTIEIGINYAHSPIYDGIIWLAKGKGIVKTLENHFSKSLASYTIGDLDGSIMNKIDSKGLMARLKPLDSLPGSPAPEETKRDIFRNLKDLLTVRNIFIVVVLFVLFLVILVLARIDMFLKRVEVDGDSRTDLALTHISVKDYEKAEKILKDLAKRSKAYPDQLNLLGIVLFELKKYDEAIKYCEMAIASNPEYLEAKINLAKSLIKKERADEALKILNELEVSRPGYADICNYIGEAHLIKKNKEGARTYFERALKINPAYETALENLRGIDIKEGAR